MLKKKKLLKKTITAVKDVTALYFKEVDDFTFSREWALQVAPQQFDDRVNKRSVFYKGVMK